ncbi:MAG: hypothetical protein JNJ46_20805 [Myxococcales bacterium]|nr:hypothetical protein [Myxococcales bacterium]
MPVFVALTASAYESDVRVCLDAGVQHVLAKPVTLDELRTALSESCPAAAQTQGAALQG